ncbi:conserved hypothetical protein [Paecilomyces variotii No. 5]|uniref:Uncharacterized protein n=1 Tax=Byssochlamys spectabilis (strain No. 5 / NBRC 109023) TaxID=1356009 RepID=V5I307_BYSSN|nr:conserved hypothetical protein [Paecilomyces variotii No. 5]
MSSYYEPQGWQAPVRQVSWEQPVPPSRSGASSVSQREESTAFSSQFDGLLRAIHDSLFSMFDRSEYGERLGGNKDFPEKWSANVWLAFSTEVDRAIDNLVKSGKLFSAPRRDSMPLMMGRHFTDYDPRVMGNVPQRHHSLSDFDARAHPASNAQGFYAAQRFQGRPNEAEQMMQAKRRMAAQRERELRNYHQEQQYNRSLLAEMSGNKSDRSLSPAAMSEESRRELIARQHRALYGSDSPAFFPPGGLSDDAPRPDNQTSGTPTSAAGARGPSPRGVDAFGLQGGSIDSSVQGAAAAAAAAVAARQSPSRANSTSSPSSGVNPAYGMYDGAIDQPVTSTSSPGGAGSPSSRQMAKSTAAPSVGPIGSRPQQTVASAVNPALNKRSTTPLPSPLGYGFAPNEAATAGPGNERSMSSASNPSTSVAPSAGSKDASSGGVSLGWGNSSGVWGSKNSLGVQASVWG